MASEVTRRAEADVMLRHCDRAQQQRHVVLVSARDLDPPEVTYLASAQIRRSEVAVPGASDLPDGPLYVHLDLDVVDSAEVPGLRYPAPGGPGSAQVAGALHMLLGTKTGLPFTYQIVGTSVVPDRTGYPLHVSQFRTAFDLLPLRGPGEINNIVRGPAYVYAILTDRRIVQ